MKLSTVTERIWDLAQSGMSEQEVADAILSTLSAKAMRALAEEYILNEAEHAVRRAEYAARRRAVANSARPEPQPQSREPGFVDLAPSYRHGTMAAVRRGCQCDECVDKARFESELTLKSQQKLADKIGALLDDYKLTLAAEWTADLLASTFGTPNGRVTWAEATVEDHRSHIAINSGAIEGYVRDSSLHQLAIDEIESKGGSCLADVLAAA